PRVEVDQSVDVGSGHAEHDPFLRAETGGMTLDPQAQVMLEKMSAMNIPSQAELGIAGARELTEMAAQIGTPPAVGAVEDLVVGGPDARLPARIYTPAGGPGSPLPLLVYPPVDMVGDFPSRAANGTGYLLTLDDMRWYRGNYLNDLSEREDVRASPLRAPSHAGLPPALVITAEYDPLRDEGEAYGE